MPKQYWTKAQDAELMRLRSEGRTAHEIANILGKTYKSVTSRIRRIDDPPELDLEPVACDLPWPSPDQDPWLMRILDSLGDADRRIVNGNQGVVRQAQSLLYSMGEPTCRRYLVNEIRVLRLSAR